MWQLFRGRELRRSPNNGARGLIRSLAHPTSIEKETRPSRPSHAELQQDVQRAASGFMDRTAQAGDPREQGSPPKSEQALLRRILMYNASVLEIATGPFPEVNALDMVVFAMLGKEALERHWIPQLFAEEGKPLVQAFACLERDAWDTAVKFLDRQQQADLRELVSAWQSEHPDQYRVEGVRLQEFSEHAGQIENARTRKARGLLGQVQSATRAADQALVISERAFFVAHRMPFLIRWQARIGVQETLSDSLARLDDVDALLRQVEAMRPMLEDVVSLTHNATAAVRETRALAEVVEPHLQRLTSSKGPREGRDPAKLLDSASRLTEQSLSLVRELRGAMPGDPARTIAALEQRLDRVLRRWILYILMGAFAWTAFFWCAYFLVRRL